MQNCGKNRAQLKAIGIVGGTGGPLALGDILSRLPRQFAVPILAMINIPVGSIAGLVTWLDERTPLNVTVAENESDVMDGHVYVASGEQTLMLVNHRTRLKECTNMGQSFNLLFRSLAQLRAGAIGVTLSGMGNDGVEGMSEIREAGGYTIVQNEATSVIYGISRVVVEIGAACESIPVDKIASRLLALTKMREI